MSRPDWDQYFMEIARVIAQRSTCLRRQVGAVIIRDNRILTTGYNGAPAKLKHCLEIGCIREKMQVPSGERHELCRAIHAEQNALIQAAVHGVSIDNSTIYITAQPCVLCAKMIVNAGIKKVVFAGDYPDQLARDILAEAGVEVLRLADS
ncbi:MAG: cytidine/deoxycytidylate deaminase family protein [Clostridia bacterium]|nr:cytidine/deoxycytidylate deaminase family protein [Clostridia bacterium]